MAMHNSHSRLAALLQAEAQDVRMHSAEADLESAAYRIEEDDEADTELREAIQLIAGEVLPAIRAHVKKELLDATRVFVCTIDSTARVMTELQELEVGWRRCTGSGCMAAGAGRGRAARGVPARLPPQSISPFPHASAQSSACCR